jgi:hypothetical protein
MAERWNDREGVLLQSNLGEKMSEVFQAFVAPYLPLAAGQLEPTRRLLTLAMIAWNCALMPEGERGEMLQDALNTFPAEARDRMKVVFEEMIRRKEQEFADVQRALFDFELTRAPSGYHLNVISTPPPGYTVDDQGNVVPPAQ